MLLYVGAFIQRLGDMRSGWLIKATGLTTFAGVMTLAGMVERESFISLLVLFSCAFIMSLIMIRHETSWRWWLAAGIIARISMLFSFPNLSDDVYRLFWDGVLSLNGTNPFLYTPFRFFNCF